MAGGPPHERSEEFEEAALPHVNALFNLALDSKLRGCDLVRLRVSDISHGG